MADHRLPGPTETARHALADSVLERWPASAPGPLDASAAGARERSLLELASLVPLAPPRDRAVFYAEDDGKRLAEAFVARDRSYMRLDDLLQETRSGAELWAALNVRGRPWSDVEEVWWQLSWRLARAAKGVVHVFGPERLVQDADVEAHRHRHAKRKFANTVFEKVELVELQDNADVTRIVYNGQPFESLE
jgi:hypothetical protein